MEIELTSVRDDGNYTWRAAGARQPKGLVAASLLSGSPKIGDVLRVEADFELDGITILQVIPQKEHSPTPDRIEIRPERPVTGGVTTTLVTREERRSGPRRRRPVRIGRAAMQRGPIAHAAIVPSDRREPPALPPGGRRRATALLLGGRRRVNGRPVRREPRPVRRAPPVPPLAPMRLGAPAVPGRRASCPVERTSTPCSSRSLPSGARSPSSSPSEGSRRCDGRSPKSRRRRSAKDGQPPRGRQSSRSPRSCRSRYARPPGATEPRLLPNSSSRSRCATCARSGRRRRTPERGGSGAAPPPP